MNKATLVGRITKELKLQKTNNSEFVNFSIACRRRFKNNNGEYESDFINCTAFGASAKFLNDYFAKGDLVGLVGEIRTSKYEKNGETRYSTYVLVEEVHFVSSRSSSSREEDEEAKAIAEVDEGIDDGIDLPFEF